MEKNPSDYRLKQCTNNYTHTLKKKYILVINKILLKYFYFMCRRIFEYAEYYYYELKKM